MFIAGDIDQVQSPIFLNLLENRLGQIARQISDDEKFSNSPWHFSGKHGEQYKKQNGNASRSSSLNSAFQQQQQ